MYFLYSAGSVSASNNIRQHSIGNGVLEKVQNAPQTKHKLTPRLTNNTKNDDLPALDFWYTQYKFELSRLGTVSLKDTGVEIHDTDTAKSMVASVKNSMLSKPSVADSAQANISPEGVMKLLGID